MSEEKPKEGFLFALRFQSRNWSELNVRCVAMVVWASNAEEAIQSARGEMKLSADIWELTSLKAEKPNSE